jgi:hypothetical protein
MKMKTNEKIPDKLHKTENNSVQDLPHKIKNVQESQWILKLSLENAGLESQE